ncbi:MAG TPA: phosphoenolpyruvate carboxykinase (ATP) [candidate division Zixibacteria bacterium]|nr:phosphoenolpyruvate carboxykinase (ATP) [candidate division Zixibacteria bacterium]
MKSNEKLKDVGITNPGVVRWNLTRSALVEEAIKNGNATLADGGALVVETTPHTGHSPKDKFVVKEPSSEANIWWGDHNQPISEESFEKVFARVQRYLDGRDIYVQELYAGADPEYRIGVRVITETAYHSLFARNMFIEIDNRAELESFVADFTVINVPNLKAVPEEDGTRTGTFVLLHLGKKLILIGGTKYAGEIKKGIFTVMNYLMPLQGVMSMHCSANIGHDRSTAVFFGLSGTGKTTLSTDPNRQLIGDDEHGWSDRGVFNYEGGCYAKVIRLSKEGEPEIYEMTHHYGTIVENVIMHPETRKINLDDDTITENTRAAYPIDYLENVVLNGTGGHPNNIILLTCDAFGVLPPVAKLTPEMTMKYFLVGYTAKVAGTEEGVNEPVATFSACFGAPFMALRPSVYAELLARKMKEHNASSWLINTGWIGGGYGVGERISLKHTRAIVTAVLDGSLNTVNYHTDPVFGLQIPDACPNVPSGILNPVDSWDDPERYKKHARNLADRFEAQHAKFISEPAPVTA